MERDDSQKDWPSDGDILWKARGGPNDFANLYVSLSNSLGVPARRVHVVTEHVSIWRDYISRREYRYETAEVHYSNDWVASNPFKGAFGNVGSSIGESVTGATAYGPSGDPIDRTDVYRTMVSSIPILLGG